MSFTKNFALRIALLAVCLLLFAFFALRETDGRLLFSLLFLGASAWAASSLFRYVNDTNRRLARLFESVRFSDFAIRFSAKKQKGDSFEAVNREFNEVLEAFRRTRAEKEANLLFLNTLVQHLNSGILAFGADDRILISNNAAFQLLGIYRLNHLDDLPAAHRPLTDFIQHLTTKNRLLYQPEPGRQLAVQGAGLSLQGRAVRLLTLQNIHPELQRKEVDAWRNLTRVLRHEMMNSITPIVSLVETMQQIVRLDLPQNEAATDLTEALDVVAARSRGLVNFVEAYRSFTAIPLPKLEEMEAKLLFARLETLSAGDFKTAKIEWRTAVQPENLMLILDVGQLEMTLLNLLKNAREAIELARQTHPQTDFWVELNAGVSEKSRPFIEVTDNGPGIAADLLDEIFIPFFTTKADGTGVGLSISRQIMQAHGGDLRAISEPGKRTRFLLEF